MDRRRGGGNNISFLREGCLRNVRIAYAQYIKPKLLWTSNSQWPIFHLAITMEGIALLFQYWTVKLIYMSIGRRVNIRFIYIFSLVCEWLLLVSWSLIPLVPSPPVKQEPTYHTPRTGAVLVNSWAWYLFYCYVWCSYVILFAAPSRHLPYVDWAVTRDAVVCQGL